MSNKVYQYYQGLPSWARGIVVVGGLVLVYIVGSTIYKKVFPAPLPADIQNNNNDISNFSTTETPTYPSSQYDNFATDISNSVGALSYDSATVKETLMKMMNNLDVALLIKAYGIRYDYKLPVLGNMGDPYDVLAVSRHIIDGDLYGLHSSRADDVNNDWASKGITYRI
jgi:hypothetical protein